MNILSRIGIDLAKNVFQLHGTDRHGKLIWKRRLSRHQWLKALQEVAPASCKIGMEACGGAHHWARKLESQGYTVKLTLPQFVKPYVKSNKNEQTRIKIYASSNLPGQFFSALCRIFQRET